MAETRTLKDKSISGTKWLGVQQVTTQVFQFAVFVILARLLDPADFGIVAMAAVFTKIAASINEFGFSSAIIQRNDCSNEYLSTAFWSSNIIGVFVFSVAVVSAPAVAVFFQNDLVGPILIVSTSTFVISSFGQVHEILLRKEMRFRQLAQIKIPSALVAGAISVVLAVLGFGVWSLVFNQVLAEMIKVVLLWRYRSWQPNLVFRKKHFKDLFAFGSQITGSSFLRQISATLDALLIGRFLGASDLGFYSMASRLADIPKARISTILSAVAFPAFSKVQDDDKQIARGYLKMVGYLSLVTLPLLAVLGVVAPEIIVLAYGSTWVPAIIPLQILAVRGALSSMGTTVGSIFLSKGRPDIQLKFQAAMVILTTLAILSGIQYGIVGVALALTGLAAVVHFFVQYLALRLISSPLRDYIRTVYPGAGIALALVVSVQSLKSIIGGLHLSQAGILILSLGWSFIIYLLLLRVLKIEEAQEIFDTVRESLGSIARRVAALAPFWPFVARTRKNS